MLTFETKRSIITTVLEKQINLVGVDDAEGPPVPIPNTEVKLLSAEGSTQVRE